MRFTWVRRPELQLVNDTTRAQLQLYGIEKIVLRDQHLKFVCFIDTYDNIQQFLDGTNHRIEYGPLGRGIYFTKPRPEKILEMYSEEDLDTLYACEIPVSGDNFFIDGDEIAVLEHFNMCVFELTKCRIVPLREYLDSRGKKSDKASTTDANGVSEGFTSQEY